MRNRLLTLTLCLLSLGAGTAPAETGILVVASDRGFAGNEETREAFASVDYRRKSLVFVTDDRSRQYLDRAVSSLIDDGAADLSVLPLFLSEADSNWQRAYGWLSTGACARDLTCAFAKPFGRSYYAVDVLDEAVRGVPDASDRQLLLVGYGNGDASAAAGIEADLEVSCELASSCAAFASVTPVAWMSDGDFDRQARTIRWSRAITWAASSTANRREDGGRRR